MKHWLQIWIFSTFLLCTDHFIFRIFQKYWECLNHYGMKHFILVIDCFLMQLTLLFQRNWGAFRCYCNFYNSVNQIVILFETLNFSIEVAQSFLQLFSCWYFLGVVYLKVNTISWHLLTTKHDSIFFKDSLLSPLPCRPSNGCFAITYLRSHFKRSRMLTNNCMK